MQNSSSFIYSHIKSHLHIPQQFPDQLKCPRCDSDNTKFCYYNNYNLSQPRHFCKNCKRYWTRGGALRNVPVGGNSRKATKRSSSEATSAASKRPACTSSSSNNSSSKNDEDSKNISLGGEMTNESLFSVRGDGKFEGQFGNLSSLLGSSEGQFGDFVNDDGLGDNGSSLLINEHFGVPGSGSGQNVNLESGMESGGSRNGDGFLNSYGGGGGDDWGGGSHGWADLAMYTPGSNFHQ